MKAKAGIFLMLIGMMCFTGFGQTTSDLPNNSTTEVSQLTEKVIVVTDAPVMVDVFTMITEDGQSLEVSKYKSGSCDFLSFRESAPKETLTTHQTSDLYTEQLRKVKGEIIDHFLNKEYPEGSKRTNVKPPNGTVENTGGRLSLFYTNERYMMLLDNLDPRSMRYGIS